MEDMKLMTRIAELEGMLDHAVRELTDTVDDVEDEYTQRRLTILLQQLEKGVDKDVN